ncbi:unnamed protein product [Prorocentrum cordatum]|uniref:Uncharacterized protein n=1 Tax=Prorocentrum cordatum TaxID=2364126 RepID=A0ABN9SN97_9DINO|nr:unnamed protein product [Polarella glacialis]
MVKCVSSLSDGALHSQFTNDMQGSMSNMKGILVDSESIGRFFTDNPGDRATVIVRGKPIDNLVSGRKICLIENGTGCRSRGCHHVITVWGSAIFEDVISYSTMTDFIRDIWRHEVNDGAIIELMRARWGGGASVKFDPQAGIIVKDAERLPEPIYIERKRAMQTHNCTLINFALRDGVQPAPPVVSMLGVMKKPTSVTAAAASADKPDEPTEASGSSAPETHRGPNHWPRTVPYTGTSSPRSGYIVEIVERGSFTFLAQKILLRAAARKKSAIPEPGRADSLAQPSSSLVPASGVPAMDQVHQAAAPDGLDGEGAGGQERTPSTQPGDPEDGDGAKGPEIEATEPRDSKEVTEPDGAADIETRTSSDSDAPLKDPKEVKEPDGAVEIKTKTSSDSDAPLVPRRRPAAASQPRPEPSGEPAAASVDSDLDIVSINLAGATRRRRRQPRPGRYKVTNFCEAFNWHFRVVDEVGPRGNSLKDIAIYFESNEVSTAFSGIDAPEVSLGMLADSLSDALAHQGVRWTPKDNLSHAIENDSACQTELKNFLGKSGGCLFGVICNFFRSEVNGAISILKAEGRVHMAVDALRNVVSSGKATQPWAKCSVHGEMCQLRKAKRHVAGTTCQPWSKQGVGLILLDDSIFSLLAWPALSYRHLRDGLNGLLLAERTIKKIHHLWSQSCSAEPTLPAGRFLPQVSP